MKEEREAEGKGPGAADNVRTNDVQEVDGGNRGSDAETAGDRNCVSDAEGTEGTPPVSGTGGSELPKGIMPLGCLFGLAYVFGMILIGILISALGTDLLFRSERRSDTGVWLLMLLYTFGAAGLSGLYGWASAGENRTTVRRQAWAVLPVAFIGAGIWTLTAMSRTGSVAEISDISWIPFYLFTYWAAPLYEALPHYIGGGRAMKGTALALSLLPAAAAVIGTGLRKREAAEARRSRILPLLLALPMLTGALALTLELLPKNTPFTPGTYPRVDGATAAIPFGRILLGELTAMNQGMAERHVRFNTTHEAYLNLIGGTADLILVAGPSEEERRLAAEAGIRFKLTPLGRDAFIFLVHRDNGVNGVRAEDLRRIYSGEITNWKELGGADDTITAFQREPNSGSQTYMEGKVMKGLKMADPPKDRKPSGMGGLIEAVADYRNARNSLGYSFYYYASEMNRSENVKFLAVDGVEPSKDHIRSGAYPYTAVLYAVTREGEPADGPAGRMLQWLQSEAGTQAIERGGFVPGTADGKEE
ncbi:MULTISPECIES: PstS family phosphate ABC transporter substrate-binding protein [Paenibacillus]|uniref:PstS family phosphate ABC transporter substrate-binding protein n=1 Tax=Paenibacillus TaxID=44249 RepID=UPI0022B8E9B5|nr:substrate-binding domain-containing protein [Paenibacillus caseinilyticus]